MRTARLFALVLVLALAIPAVLPAIASSAAVKATDSHWNGLSAAGQQAAIATGNRNIAQVMREVEPSNWVGYDQLTPAQRENLKKIGHINQAPIATNVPASNPAEDPAPGVTESEVAITADGNGHVLVAWNDGLGFTSPNTLSSYAYSCDDGVTFTDGGNVPRINASTDQCFGDCTLDHDGHGNFYLCQIYTTTGQQDCAVHRGTFGSSGCTFTWNTPVICAVGVTTSSALDKPWIVADKSAALGHVYVTYSRFSSVTAIEAVTSADGGATWAPAVVIQTGPTGTGFPSGTHPAMDNAGNVYVVWQGSGASQSVQCDLSAGIDDNMYFSKTTNQGATWSNPTVLGPVVTGGNIGSGPGNIRDRLNSFPDLAVDNSGGPRDGSLYCIWAESATWGAPNATGDSLSELNRGTAADSNGVPGASGVLTVPIGTDAVGTISSGDLDYWKLNLTAGQTLLLRLEPQGFNCGVASTTRNFRIRLYAAPQNTAVSPPDTLLGSSNRSRFTSQILFDVKRTGTYYFRVQNVASSGTTTGQYRVKVRQVTYNAPFAQAPSRDMRDVVVAHSSDGGATWSNPVLVNGDGPAGYDDLLPFVTVDNCGQVHAFWFDRRETETLPNTNYEAQLTDIYTGASADGGVTWGLGQRITDESSFFNNNTNAVPNMGDYNNAVAVGPSVYVGWSDERISHAGVGVWSPGLSYPSGSGPDAYAAKFPTGCVRTNIEIAAMSAQVGRGYVTVAWSASLDGVAHFQVQRSLSPNAGFVAVGDAIEGLGHSGAFTYRDESVSPGVTYYYRIAYNDGSLWHYSGAIQAVTPGAVFALHAIRPNPTSGPARLDYEIARSGRVAIEIYNLSGQRVRTLLNSVAQPGVGSVQWDGRGENGQPVAAGAYFARLTSAGQALTQRVMVLR